MSESGIKWPKVEISGRLVVTRGGEWKLVITPDSGTVRHNKEALGVSRGQRHQYGCKGTVRVADALP